MSKNKYHQMFLRVSKGIAAFADAVFQDDSQTVEAKLEAPVSQPAPMKPIVRAQSGYSMNEVWATVASKPRCGCGAFLGPYDRDICSICLKRERAAAAEAKTNNDAVDEPSHEKA